MKLSDDLKRMLTSLAYQDAGEFLSTSDKMKMLGIGAEPKSTTSLPSRKKSNKQATHRVALISDGRGQGAPLDYAIETCSRLEAKIDLLIHGTVDTANITALEDRIRSAGLYSQTVMLGSKSVEDIFNYIHSQTSIVSIVAMPDDKAAKRIIEEVVPRQGGCMHIPLVLIEDRASSHRTKRSAA